MAGRRKRRDTASDLFSLLKDNKLLRQHWLDFFRSAIRSRATDIQQLHQWSLGSGLRLKGGRAFGLDQEHSRFASILYAECSKILGSRLDNERLVLDISWEVVQDFFDQRVEEDTDVWSWLRFVEIMAREFSTPIIWAMPNFIFELQSELEGFVLGPVALFRAQELDRRFSELTSGDCPPIVQDSTFRYAFDQQPRRFLVTPTVWCVTFQASSRHAEEEACWLIDVAVSMLRLWLFGKWQSHIPMIGDLEQSSVGVISKGRDNIFVKGERWYIDGVRLSSKYLVDSEVIDIINSELVQGIASTLFLPKANSLAERLHQALGWLSRARQSQSRSERFLYFFTAIESLLSENDSRAPVVETISRHIACMFDDSPNERLRTAKTIKDLYTKRSQLVHRGIRSVLESEVNLLQVINESLCHRILTSCELNEDFSSFRDRLVAAGFGEKWEPRYTNSFQGCN